MLSTNRISHSLYNTFLRGVLAPGLFLVLLAFSLCSNRCDVYIANDISDKELQARRLEITSQKMSYLTRSEL